MSEKVEEPESVRTEIGGGARAPEPGLCRDCGGHVAQHQSRCPDCASRRITRHAELNSLSIAHIDCDAFYASVEKRDRPELLPLPVVVGGGHRGVVSAACYIARAAGVRSAMPMFKALRLCPDAAVLKPDMAKHVVAARRIPALMERLTPLVQPLSIDKAELTFRAPPPCNAPRPPPCSRASRRRWSGRWASPVRSARRRTAC